MNCTERRKELLSWLEKEGSLSNKEIAEYFNVTKMTVHRDLILLEKRQALRRIHGGVLANNRAGIPKDSSGDSLSDHPHSQCLICYRSPTQNLIYNLTLNNGESRQACCPHCGISAHLLHKDKVVMALTADYLTGRQHPAQNSHFLMGSIAAPCCHPSILTFENKEMAERFQTGFGGTLGSLNDAMTFLQQEMSVGQGKNSCPHCSPQAG